LQNIINTQIQEHLEVFENIKVLSSDIQDIAKILISTISKNNKIIICGNGGSASDANHFSAEIVGRYKKDLNFPAISLSSNTSIITSIANDYGYEYIFSKQILAIANKNDTIIALSTSGNSQNIINALSIAKEKQCNTIGFSGKNGGKMKNLCDICLCVNSENTPIIQEAHLFISHLLCDIIDNKI
jgi:D-sedoheptulose 7-phosphate isomerase